MTRVTIDRRIRKGKKLLERAWDALLAVGIDQIHAKLAVDPVAEGGTFCFTTDGIRRNSERWSEKLVVWRVKLDGERLKLVGRGGYTLAKFPTDLTMMRTRGTPYRLRSRCCNSAIMPDSSSLPR